MSDTKKSSLESAAKTDGTATTSAKSSAKSSLESAVTTDMENTTEEGKAAKKAADAAAKAPKGFIERANEAGIGLIKVDGYGLQYIGVAPAREKNPESPSGDKITPERSTFTPLDQVIFHPSIRIKDPKSGEYYFPQDGCTSWEGCELNGSKLIPESKK